MGRGKRDAAAREVEMTCGGAQSACGEQAPREPAERIAFDAGSSSGVVDEQDYLGVLTGLA